MRHALDIHSLTKKFGKNTALHSISCTAYSGEVFGLLGPNGAGKTTLLKILLGLISPTKGTTKILHKSSENISVREHIGFLPEEPIFYEYLSGKEFLLFVGGLFGMSKKESQKKSDELFCLVGLGEKDQKKKIRAYSKGMKQRIGLAQALMNDPDFLILDEPMNGLDPIGRRDFKNIILQLKKKEKTILFTSHILTDAEELCDRIGILNKGKLLVCDVTKKIIPKEKKLEDVFIEMISSEK